GTATVGVSGVPQGGRFPVGITTLTWTAADAVGNTSTATQTITVSCPVGTIAGEASLTCDGVTSPSEGVVVRLLNEGTPFRDVATGPGGGYAFGEVRLGTYTVEVVPPNGFAVPIDTRLVNLDLTELSVEPFVFTCLLEDVAGQVTGTCD